MMRGQQLSLAIKYIFMLDIYLEYLCVRYYSFGSDHNTRYGLLSHVIICITRICNKLHEVTLIVLTTRAVILLQ